MWQLLQFPCSSAGAENPFSFSAVVFSSLSTTFRPPSSICLRGSLAGFLYLMYSIISFDSFSKFFFKSLLVCLIMVYV